MSTFAFNFYGSFKKDLASFTNNALLKISAMPSFTNKASAELHLLFKKNLPWSAANISIHVNCPISLKRMTWSLPLSSEVAFPYCGIRERNEGGSASFFSRETDAFNSFIYTPALDCDDCNVLGFSESLPSCLRE